MQRAKMIYKALKRHHGGNEVLSTTVSYIAEYNGTRIDFSKIMSVDVKADVSAPITQIADTLPNTMISYTNHNGIDTINYVFNTIVLNMDGGGQYSFTYDTVISVAGSFGVIIRYIDSNTPANKIAVKYISSENEGSHEQQMCDIVEAKANICGVVKAKCYEIKDDTRPTSSDPFTFMTVMGYATMTLSDIQKLFYRLDGSSYNYILCSLAVTYDYCLMVHCIKKYANLYYTDAKQSNVLIDVTPDKKLISMVGDVGAMFEPSDIGIATAPHLARELDPGYVTGWIRNLHDFDVIYGVFVILYSFLSNDTGISLLYHSRKGIGGWKQIKPNATENASDELISIGEVLKKHTLTSITKGNRELELKIDPLLNELFKCFHLDAKYNGITKSFVDPQNDTYYYRLMYYLLRIMYIMHTNNPLAGGSFAVVSNIMTAMMLIGQIENADDGILAMEIYATNKLGKQSDHNVIQQKLLRMYGDATHALSDVMGSDSNAKYEAYVELTKQIEQQHMQLTSKIDNMKKNLWTAIPKILNTKDDALSKEACKTSIIGQLQPQTKESVETINLTMEKLAELMCQLPKTNTKPQENAKDHVDIYNAATKKVKMCEKLIEVYNATSSDEMKIII